MIGDIVWGGQRVLKFEVRNRIYCEDNRSGGRHPGDTVSNLPLDSDDFRRESGNLRGGVESVVTRMDKPKSWCFVEDRGGYAVSEAIQGGRPIVIQTMTKSCGPVNELPSVVAPGRVVVGGTMGLAGTKYVGHNAGTGTLQAVKLCGNPSGRTR